MYENIIESIFFLIFSLLFSGCSTHDRGDENSKISSFAIRVNESQKYYDALVVREPGNKEAWLYKGLYYLDTFGQYEEAISSFNVALELDPEYALAWYAKGITLSNMNRMNESEICLQKARYYDPSLT
jgi:Putative Zn-dependent protease, contains TPR repeats